MKPTIKFAVAFTTLAALTGQAYAEKGPDEKGPDGFRHLLLEEMDGDKSGDVTFEEFKKAAGDRFTLADVNKDGKVTVEEMAAAIEKVRAEKLAKRMIKRLDIDGDGSVTQIEVDTSRQEVFALMDRNNDGKLVKEEMKRKKKGWFGRKDSRDGNNSE